MAKQSSSLSMPENGLPLIGRPSIAQMVGFRKYLTRAEYDAAIAAERARIASNGAGLYRPQEEIAIEGEIGARQWQLATGGTDAQNAANSHAKQVLLPNGAFTILKTDANTCIFTQGNVYTNTSAKPTTPIVDGNAAFDPSTGMLFSCTTAWDDGVRTGVAPQPLKTINGQPVAGTGNIDIPSGSAQPAQLVDYTTVWPLDADGNGKYSVEHELTGNEVISFSGSQIGGNYSASILATNGPFGLTFPGSAIVVGAFNGDKRNVILTERTPGGVVVIIQAADLPVGPSATASVETANPDRVVLTWNGPIDSTISATAAFSVNGGRTVSAHTFVDATHTYLTVSTPFGAGQNGVVVYAPPSANKMKGTDGLLSDPFSAAISNNIVAVAGALSATSITPPNRGVDLTAEGTRGWLARFYERALHKQGYQGRDIAPLEHGNFYGDPYSSNGPTGYSFSDNSSDGGIGSSTNGYVSSVCYFNDAPNGKSFGFTVPIDTVQQTIEIHFIASRDEVVNVAASLSDNSADSITRPITGTGLNWNDARSVRLVVKAGSANQTLALSITGQNGGGLGGYLMVAY